MLFEMLFFKMLRSKHTNCIKYHRDDTIEVGAQLYEIDTEAKATVSSPADSTPSETAAAPVEVEAPPAKEETAQSHDDSNVASSSRTPSIKFLGKSGWESRRSGETAPGAVQSLVPDKPNGVITLDGSTISATYGRPIFTDDEIEALMSGGANLAPELVSPSKGAVFASS